MINFTLWQKFQIEESTCRFLQLESSRPFAAKAKKEGKFVHQLNIGQPDIPTPEWAINDLKSTDFKVVEYSPSEGELSFVRHL